VPCSDHDALINCAVRLARDAELRNRLRSHARSALLAQSWERVVDRFEADLLSVVEATRKKSANPEPLRVAHSLS
ncbi:MAG: glycosyltransferase family 1 protein, partial [Opitutus sp.]